MGARTSTTTKHPAWLKDIIYISLIVGGVLYTYFIMYLDHESRITKMEEKYSSLWERYQEHITGMNEKVTKIYEIIIEGK